MSWRILHSLPHISHSAEGSHVSIKCRSDGDTGTVYLQDLPVFSTAQHNKPIHTQIAKEQK